MVAAPGPQAPINPAHIDKHGSCALLPGMLAKVLSSGTEPSHAVGHAHTKAPSMARCRDADLPCHVCRAKCGFLVLRTVFAHKDSSDIPHPGRALSILLVP